MRVVFASTSTKPEIPVSDSHGCQSVVGVLEDNGDMIVLLVDKITNKSYIEKIDNKFAINLYESINFNPIESDDEFNIYYNYFKEIGLLPETH